MSRSRGLVVAVGFAVALVCGVASEAARAQDMWPMGTLSPPAPTPLPPVPAPTVLPPAPTILPPAQAAPPSAQSAAPSKSAAVISPAAQQTGGAQLAPMVAPVALYPDPLLGQVLMASTYPQDVVEAARWVRAPANRALSGDALTSALRAKGWNPSVMALVPFPSLLPIMADKREWTEQLGKAFLAKQGDVMAAIQHLRHAALAAGNLRATPECHCVIQTRDDIISIQPSEGDLVSIPIYKPAAAFGKWAGTAPAPAEFPLPPGFVFTADSVVGFNPAIEVALFGPIWGWESIDWPNHRIIIDNARYAKLAPGHPAFAGGAWVHEGAPPRKVVRNVLSVVTHAGHHAKSAAVRRFAMMNLPPPYPPPYWWGPRHSVWALPPGTIVVPPPPPRHIARNWHDGYYDPYR
jgi:hypothetical protein